MIVSVVFLVLAALFTFLGMLKGKKYTWVFSALRIVGIAVTAVLAMWLSSLVGGFVGELATDAIGDSLKGNAQGLLNDLPSASLAITALIAMLAAPILFWVLFPVVYNLLNIVIKVITRVLVKVLPQTITKAGTPETKKKRLKNRHIRAVGKNPIGLLLGGVCGFLLFCVALVPMVGLTGTVHDVAAVAVSAAGEENVPTEIAEALDVSVNNAGSAVVRTIGGKALYNGMTTYRADGETIYLNRELRLVGAVTGAFVSSNDKDISRAEAGKAIRDIEPALKETVLLPRIGAELLDAASNSWLEGKAYHGVSMPSSKGYEKAMKAIVRTQQGATPESFREDVGTIVRIVAHITEQDAMGELKGDVMSLLKNEALTEPLLYELIENPRLYVTVSSMFDIGLDGLAENLKMQKTRDELYAALCEDLAAVERLQESSAQARAVDITENEKRVRDAYQKVMENYGIRVERDVCLRAARASLDPTVDMAAWFAEEGVVSAETMSEKSELVTSSELAVNAVAIQNKQAEAKTLAHALSVIADVAEQASKDDMDISLLIKNLGPALDALAATETIGQDKSQLIFKATLQSQKVSENIGFSVLEASDAADAININSQRSSYSAQMISLSQTITVLKNTGTEDSSAAIEALIKDLTPESASTLQAISTPSVLLNHNVPERSAEPAADMMSNMFGNLSDAKEKDGMTDEQLQKETVAVNKVMDIAMNAGDKNGSVFGEGSITGSSADQFVNDIMDSTVVSKTVMEQVYGESGDASNDPLNTERNMTADEEAQLVDALNNKWMNATDEEKADETYQKKIVALGALMNVEVSIGANGVTKIA